MGVATKVTAFLEDGDETWEHFDVLRDHFDLLDDEQKGEVIMKFRTMFAGEITPSTEGSTMTLKELTELSENVDRMYFLVSDEYNIKFFPELEEGRENMKVLQEAVNEKLIQTK